MELCNAGQCRPLLLRREVTERIDATGLPLGLFCGGQFPVTHIGIEAGDSLVLYSDGITEAEDPQGNQYGEERLIRSLREHFDQDAKIIADEAMRDLARFRRTRAPNDDMTLLIVRRRH